MNAFPRSRRSPWVGAFVFAVAVAAWACLHAGAHPQASPRPSDLAYIGPGAGFAFLGSFLTLVAGFFLSLLSFLVWPFRMAWRLIRRRKGYAQARVRKIVFLGLDGLDPRLTERWMAEGKLPNLARLAASGSYSRLRTTFPSL